MLVCQLSACSRAMKFFVCHTGSDFRSKLFAWRTIPRSFFIAILGTSVPLFAQYNTGSPLTAQFIEKNCSDCHDAETQKAGLDLLDLPFQPTNEDNFALWVKVHDRVKASEMPPKKRARPDPTELDMFIKNLSSDLRNAERAEIEKTGRAMMRRLNRYEYENTVRDLLDVP